MQPVDAAFRYRRKPSHRHTAKALGGGEKVPLSKTRLQGGIGDIIGDQRKQIERQARPTRRQSAQCFIADLQGGDRIAWQQDLRCGHGSKATPQPESTPAAIIAAKQTSVRTLASRIRAYPCVCDATDPRFGYRRRADPHTNRLCTTAARMKSANSGCGSNGRLFSSG